LQSITKEESEKAGSNITPLVKSLSGIINMQQVDNFKKDYASHLVKKYK